MTRRPRPRRPDGDVWGLHATAAESTFPAWDAYSEKPASFLHWTVSADALLHEARRAAVAQLRAAGMTWREVGGLLKVTPQAAQQRYGAPRR